jgi:hypothetical protein
MQYRAASSRRSVAFGIVFAVALMVLSFLAVLSATRVQAQSSQCAGADNVATFDGTQDQTTETFKIKGDSFRLAFNIQGSGRLDVAVLDENSRVEDRVEVNGDGTEIIDLGPGTFRLEIQADNNVDSYDIDVDDCLGDGVNTAQVNRAQNSTDTTTADTTTADTASPTADANTAASNANAANANTNVNRDGSFQCELFLRTIRDGRGAVRTQYESIVQRFEQCLSGNVLADTIPNRNLPFTGGMSLLALAAIGLAALVAGAAVLRAVMRRGG